MESFNEKKSIEVTPKFNQSDDLFSKLEEVRIMKRRLYNPRLRTPEAEKVWENLPDFLEKNKELLMLMMGSREVAVHLHGSMLLGVGTSGRRNAIEPPRWDIPPSDIDLFIFVGEPDENEERYQAEYGNKDKNLPIDLQEDERIHRFIEKTDFQKKLGHRGDGIIVRVPQLIDQIKNICQKLSDNEKLSEEDLFAIYKATMLFGSDALFQSSPELEGKWRNNLLKILLEHPSGEFVWNNGIRKYFDIYFVRYEENSLIPGQIVKKSHKKRVEVALEEILNKREIPTSHRERAKNYLRNQRITLGLPSFDSIKVLKDKLFY